MSIFQLQQHRFIALVIVLLFCVGLLFLVTVDAQAAFTPKINYQGKLTNTSGSAVADGTYNMRFWLLTTPSIATTSAVWTESLTGSNKVQVQNGLFSVMLGSTSPLTSVDFDQPLYLGVEIGGTGSPSWDGEMSPRKVIGSVPSAFEAEHADDATTVGGVASTSFLRSDQADTATGLLTFSNGFLSQSSSTIARLTTLTATTTNLVVNGERFTDLTGTGLQNSGNTLSINTTYLNTLYASTTAFDTCSELAAIMSGETGTCGSLVFSASPTFTGTVNAAALTLSSTLTLSGSAANIALGSNYLSGDGGDEGIYIDSTGRVGIGTAAPTAALEVVGDIVSKGTRWATSSAAASNGWQNVAYGNGLFVAVSSNGTNRVMTSPDGVTWTARSVEASQWRDITYGNGLFVAVADSGTNRVMTSPDGVTWTARSAAEANSWFGVAYGNGLFAAVSSDGTNQVMTSPDGITWTARAEAEANAWTDITHGNGLFVAVSANGTNRVMTSSNGITWTAQAGVASSWSDITYGNGLFVAVGSNVIMTSPNATTWTSRTSPANNGWNAITYGNGLFVAVSSNNSSQIMTSPDGITWTARTEPVSGVWLGVTYGNGRFVSVPNGATIMYSGQTEQYQLVHNNVYQGGFSLMSGNLGIGTTTPNQALSIFRSAADAAVEFSTVSGSAEKWTIGIDDSDGTKFKISSSSALGTNDRFVIDGAGRVGIGVSSPSARLHLISTTEQLRSGYDASNYLTVTTGSTGTTTFDAVGTSPAITFSDDDFQLADNSDPTKRMAFQLSGISAGTRSLWTFPAGSATFVGTNLTQTLTNKTLTAPTLTSPTITGSATTSRLYISGALYDSTGAAGTNGYVLRSTGTSTRWVATSTLGFLANASIDTCAEFAAIMSGETGTCGSLVLSADPTFTGTVNAAALTLSSTLTLSGSAANIALGSNWLSGDGGDEGVFVASDGKVGIGTTSPDYALDVAGAIVMDNGNFLGRRLTSGVVADLIGFTGNNLEVGEYTTLPDKVIIYTPSDAGNAVEIRGGNSIAWFSNNGNVGIGDTSPDHLLDIASSTAAAGIVVHAGGTDHDAYLGFQLTDGTNNFTLGVDDSDSDKFKISGTALGTNDWFTIDATGRVGIGSSTPSQELSVTGDLSVTGRIYDSSNSAGTNGMVLKSTGSGFNWVATSTLGITGGSSLFTDGGATTYLTASTDNLGLGTSTANQALTIFRNATDAAIEFSTVSGSNEKWTIGVDDSDGTKFKISSSSALGTNDRFVINGAGNIGIGTSSPTVKLDVVGSGYFHGNGTLLSLNPNGAVSDINRISVTGNRAMFGYNGTNANAVIQAGVSKGIEFNVNNGTFGSGQAAVLTTAGNFGIGTTTPAAKLQVLGTSQQLRLGYDASNYLTVTTGSTGTTTFDAVGTSPALMFADNEFQLFDNSDNTKRVEFQLSGIAAGTKSTWTFPAGTGTFVGLSQTQTLTNKTLTAPTLTSPTITGSATTSRLYISGALYDTSSSAGTNGYVLRSTGTSTRWVATSTLGFGTGTVTGTGSSGRVAYWSGASALTSDSTFTFASSKLTVPIFNTTNGSTTVLSINNTPFIVASTTRNILALGVGARISATSTANNAIFIGTDAGRNSSNANQAVFIGESAGMNAFGSGVSTFIGTGAGYGAVNSPFSIFIGDSSGYEATSTLYSVFIGEAAGNAAADADRSIFMGYSAGDSAANADNDIFMGYSAGNLAVNANNSIFMGDYAGDSASADFATFMGYYAGSSATNASYSNFFGYEAGNSAANASNALFLGYRAGYNDTVNNTSNSGSSIAIGRYAGTGGYSNSIALGRGVINSSSTQINIGNLLYGTNIYNSDTQTATPVSTGRIGIGTSTPNQILSLFRSGGDAAIEFSTVSGANEKWTIGIDDSDSAKFKISSSSALGTNDRFVIDGRGYVGIGDSTPDALLDVDVTAASAYAAHLMNQSSTGYGQYIWMGNSLATRYALAVDNNSGGIFRLTNAGSIGLGTSTPNQALTIFRNAADAAIEFSTVSGANEKWTIGVDDSDGTKFKISSSSALGTNDRLVIDGAGNIGIGTSSPSNTLHIAGTSASFADSSEIIRLENTTGHVAGIGFKVSTTYNDYRLYNNFGSLDVYNTSDGRTNFRIDSSGNVHLAGNGADTAPALTATVGGLVGIGTSTPNQALTIFRNAADAAIEFSTVSGANEKWTIGVDDSDGTKFKISSSSALGTNDRLVIDGAGNVGIGVTSPYARLHVIGSAAEEGSILINNYEIKLDNSGQAHWSILNGTSTGKFMINDTSANANVGIYGTNRFTINTNGNVGIGTTTPKSKLSVYGDLFLEGTSRYLNFGTATGTNGYGIRDNAGTIEIKNNGGSWSSVGGGSQWTTSGTNAYFNLAGNVGIGTTTPKAVLSIVGTSTTASSTPFSIWNSAGTLLSKIADSGKAFLKGSLGIGTQTPQRILDVLETNSVAQVRLSKSLSLYAELLVDGVGDLFISTIGGNVRLADENLHICEGGACPTSTATSTAGNIFVENAVTIGSGFSLRQLSSQELGMYNASGTLMIIFDNQQ